MTDADLVANSFVADQTHCVTVNGDTVVFSMDQPACHLQLVIIISNLTRQLELANYQTWTGFE